MSLRYRDENRKTEPKKGAENPGAGSKPSAGPYKGAGFPKPSGATQPKARNLGFRKVKTSMDQKGF